MSEEKPSENNQEQPSFTVHYIKSAHFRTVHMDGIFGSISPSGFIHMAAFNERYPIPNATEHHLAGPELLPPPLNTIGKNGIVRELDVDMVFSAEVAKNLRDWLSDRLAEHENLFPQKKV